MPLRDSNLLDAWQWFQVPRPAKPHVRSSAAAPHDPPTLALMIEEQVVDNVPEPHHDLHQ